MSDKMLVTQALDERDLLVKKIADKIAKASFVDTIKPNEDKVYAKRIAKDEYAKQAESAYRQILDLIERFQKIDAAIAGGDKAEATAAYTTAVKAVDQAAAKHLLHKNNASNKKSKMTTKLNGMA